MNAQNVSLRPSTTPGALADLAAAGRGVLRLPPGPPGHYRLAQLDDYGPSSQGRARAQFLWDPPLTFRVRARASHPKIPGTWGFGLWNAPLSLSLGFGGGRILPVLPNAAWFFFASPENYLSLRDDKPASGALTSTFRSLNLPALALAPGASALPVLFFPPAARFLRRFAARVIQQDADLLRLDPTEWHEYTFDWRPSSVLFLVDGQVALETSISPRGPLGIVIWIDNQFAAWKPDGRLQWGVLGWGEEGWVEFEGLKIT